MLKPIKKKRLFEEIIVALENFIKNEKILPGEKLPSEGELARIFDVSKTTVREAMSVLHTNGITESRPGMGIYLKQTETNNIIDKVASNLLEKRDLVEILEFRRGLEVEAASLAAKRSTEEDIRAIQTAQMDVIRANDEGHVGVKEDFLFHKSIILATHNSIYKNMFDSFAHKFKQGLRLTRLQSVNVPGRFREGQNEHYAIINAIIDRNPEKASIAMRGHLTKNENKIWKNMK